MRTFPALVIFLTGVGRRVPHFRWRVAVNEVPLVLNVELSSRHLVLKPLCCPTFRDYDSSPAGNYGSSNPFEEDEELLAKICNNAIDCCFDGSHQYLKFVMIVLQLWFCFSSFLLSLPLRFNQFGSELLNRKSLLTCFSKLKNFIQMDINC